MFHVEQFALSKLKVIWRPWMQVKENVPRENLRDPDCCGSVQLNKRKDSGLKGRPELQLCRLRRDMLLRAWVTA